MVAGTTGSYGTGNEAWIIKTDANGYEEWNKTFGSDVFRSVVPELDGSYVLAGTAILDETGGSYLRLMKVRNTGSSNEKSRQFFSETNISREGASGKNPDPVPGFDLFPAVLVLYIISLMLKKGISNRRP